MCNYALAVVLALLLVTNIGLGDAKRTYGSNRKTSTSSNSGHVTRPTYNNNNGASSGSNSHADVAKLSYPNYNSQPNRPATATGGQNQPAAPIGWNVPKQQGPPPAYSASNPAGGAHTNMHETAPAYRPNNAAPPSYNAASGGNVHTPITATNAHGVQNSYPSQQYNPGGYNSAGSLPAGATYHSPGALPAGASYYPSAGHVPAGGYYPGGGAGGHYPGGGYQGGGMPAGATYLPAGAAIPAGATYYSQPPQQSSGLGFGSGLAAGAIGGALLGHALTPTHTRVVEQAPMNSGGGGGGGDDKIIIINNGPPGSVTTTSAGGATVITTGAVAGQAVNSTDPAAPGDAPPAPLAPFAANPNPPAVDGAQMPPQMPSGPMPEQPAPGGIICVPVRVNETDPNDSAKMIEVEKVACYPAPPPPAPDANGMPAAPVDGAAPLAPMVDPVPGQSSQQLQQSPTQATLLPEQSSVRASGAAASMRPYVGFLLSTLVALLLAFGRQ